MPHVQRTTITSVCLSTVHLISFFNAPPPTVSYPLSLHDALPICPRAARLAGPLRTCPPACRDRARRCRSEEHTSELQSRVDLVCRLLLEKKNSKRPDARG